MPDASVQIHLHDTPQDWWDTLSKVFTPWEQGAHTGIKIEVDGVKISFYGPRTKDESSTLTVAS